MATEKQCKEFIKKIAPLIKRYAAKYGIKVVSAIIAQACLESAYGTSDKAKKHNYFGLKYRKNRVTCHSGYFKDGSKEQKKNGSYTPISTDWYSFSSIEKGVEGYFQFINTTNYKNVKGVIDPETYLTNLKNDGYATSKNYVSNNMAVIKKWDLTKYDSPTYATVNTKSDPLVLRKSNSALSAKLCTIPKGKKVEIVQKGTNWTKCKYNNKTGYCATKYLKY